jgi:hypothetical protein
MLPAGAVGVSLLLGSAAPSDANDHPTNAYSSSSSSTRVSERLTAIRDAVSAIAPTLPGEARLAWGNNWPWNKWWYNW